MKDLLTFKNHQIKALQDEVTRLKEHNIQLSTWVFEVCDEDCPKEYRELVRTEVTKEF